MKPKVLVAVVAAVVVLGAGAWFAYGLLVSPASDNAIDLVPRDAKFYGNLFLDPSNDQKKAIESIIGSTPFKTPERVEEKFSDLLDTGLKETGCTFEEDVKPWLGNQIAGFASEFSDEGAGALLVATSNEDAAIDAVRKCSDEDSDDWEEATYKDYSYLVTGDDEVVGTINGNLVLASKTGFEAVADTAAGGPALQDSDRFQQARARHSSDNIAFFYVDVQGMLQAMQESGEIEPGDAAALQTFYGSGEIEPLTFSLQAEPKAIVLEYAAALPNQGEGAQFTDLFQTVIEPDIVPNLPGGAWGAYGIGNLGEYIDTTLDFVSGSMPGGRGFIEAQFQKQTGLSLSDDVLSWMGDAGLFIQGTSPQTLSGGLVLETSDTASSARAIEVLKAFAKRQAKNPFNQGLKVSRPTFPGVEGFAVQDETMPQPINVVVGGDKIVVAYGDLATQQALDSDVTLGEQDLFKSAQSAVGEGYSIVGYFAVDPIQDLVESAVLPTLQTFDPGTMSAVPDTEAQEHYEEDVKPFIDPLAYIAFGGKVDGDLTLARVVVGVE